MTKAAKASGECIGCGENTTKYVEGAFCCRQCVPMARALARAVLGVEVLS